MTTFGEALAEGRAALAMVDIGSAAFDARLLLAAAAGLDMAALIARSGEALPAVAQASFDTYIKRRLQGEPVARIVGEAEFWGLKFKLNEATLVPRPETETLVEAVLRETSVPPRARICDLGTGCGAIMIALLTELPDARGVATDVSEGALEMARFNAERHGVLARVRFLNVGFAQGPHEAFDVVVVNPPYIRTDTIRNLQPEVREHDPHLALDGGPDGLCAYREILSRSGNLLADGGLLAFEVGHDQGQEVAALCRKETLANVRTHPDLAGRERVVTASQRVSGAAFEVAKKALGKVG